MITTAIVSTYTCDKCETAQSVTTTETQYDPAAMLAQVGYAVFSTPQRDNLLCPACAAGQAEWWATVTPEQAQRQAAAAALAPVSLPSQ